MKTRSSIAWKTAESQQKMVMAIEMYKNASRRQKEAADPDIRAAYEKSKRELYIEVVDLTARYETLKWVLEGGSS